MYSDEFIGRLQTQIDELKAKQLEFIEVFKAEANKTKVERDRLSCMINDLRVLVLNTVSKEEFTAMIALEEKTNANLKGEILELKAALTVDEHRINELVDMLAQTGDVLNARIDEKIDALRGECKNMGPVVYGDGEGV